LRGDYKQSEYGRVMTVNRHFYVFKSPRSLEEIDAELKGVTAKIMTMLEGLAE
jgi:type I restriction enzyme M protein